MEARRRARSAAAAPEYLANLHFDWPYRSHWKLFVLSAGSVTFPDAGSCCAWCITSSTLNNQHQGRQSLAFVTMAIGKGGITPVFFFAHFLRCPCFCPVFHPFVPRVVVAATMTALASAARAPHGAGAGHKQRWSVLWTESLHQLSGNSQDWWTSDRFVEPGPAGEHGEVLCK